MVAVLAVGLGLGGLVRQLRREREQVALVGELNQAGIYTWAYEPNSVGRILQALRIPEEWYVKRPFHWTFFHSPSRIAAFSIREDSVPYLIERMTRLPYLKSVSFKIGQISHEAEQRIRTALPSVELEFDPLSAGPFPVNRH